MLMRLLIRIRCALAVVAVLFLFQCKSTKESAEAPLFTLLDSMQTGIGFRNTLKFDSKFNIYTYRNFYNGGGVSIGDVNNDGLVDVYLTAINYLISCT